jgi:hypothetical protein
MLLNPLFVIHLARSGFDSLFVGPLSLFLESEYCFSGAMFVAIARQFFVSPEPSLSLLWLIDSHYLTEFRISARVTIGVFQAVSLFLGRNCERGLALVLYAISDPCADWASLSLLAAVLLPRANRHMPVNIAILMIGSAFVFSNAAFEAWWAMGTGNANFAMVGSLIYSGGLLVLLRHFAE